MDMQGQLKQRLKAVIRTIAENDLKMQYEELEALLAKPENDRILGCLYGAFIGDSLGSFLQFQDKEQATTRQQIAMKMPGGGMFNTKPGQVTDDSEMALHLLHGLLEFDPERSFKEQIPHLTTTIAKQYITWTASNPFDIGRTCSSGINLMNKNMYGKSVNGSDYERVVKGFSEVTKYNMKSLSNGSLMRITPLACFYALLGMYKPVQVDEFNQLLEGDAKNTHGNSACFKANYYYIQIISRMIRRNSHEDIKKIQQYFQNQVNQVKSEQDIVINFMKEGFKSQINHSLMPANENMGFFKIAFTYVFHYFRQIAQNCPNQSQLSSQLYKNIISKVISEGGDTDTNACIVGGFIGSIIGFRNLPQEYLIKQLTLKLGFNDTHRKDKVEIFYQPKNGFINLIKLIKKFK